MKEKFCIKLKNQFEGLSETTTADVIWEKMKSSILLSVEEEIPKVERQKKEEMDE